MKLAVVRLLSLLAPLALSAAIVTERNDVCVVPPEHAKFVGTASNPGIASCWIPWGTYTDGSGSTEYTRASAHFVGVLISVLDGFMERNRYYAYGGSYKWMPYPLRSFDNPQVEDGGEFYVTFSNYCASTRIVDMFNGKRFMEKPLDDFYYSSHTIDIENDLLSAALDTYYGGRYSSRHLYDLTGNVAPPLSTSWSSALPFQVSQTNDWKYVWPTFRAMSTDPYFVTEENRTYAVRGDMSTWMDFLDAGPNFLGDDYYEGVYALWTALKDIYVETTMEDVLGVDTGWIPPVATSDYWTVTGPEGTAVCRRIDVEYDYEVWSGQLANDVSYDIVNPSTTSAPWVLTVVTRGIVGTYEFTIDNTGTVFTVGNYSGVRTYIYPDTIYSHWTNGTTRLDWKRLGIVCQLERQMEITHWQSSSPGWLARYEIDLPLFYATGSHLMRWASEKELALPAPSRTSETNVISISGLSWTEKTNVTSTATNRVGWSYPTCRTPAPHLSGSAAVTGVAGGSYSISRAEWEHDLLDYINAETADAGSPLADGEYYVEQCPTPTVVDEPPGLDWGWGSCMVSPMSGGAPVCCFFSACKQIDCTIGYTGTVAVTRSARKDASALFTYALDDLYNETISHYDIDWSNTATLDVTALDVLMSVYDVGAASYASSTNNAGSESWLNWDDIAQLSRERLFRLNPEATTSASLSAAKLIHWNMMRNLSTATKTKCVSLGGFSPGLNPLTTLTAAEMSQIKQSVEAERIRAVYTVQPNDVYSIGGTLVVEDGRGTQLTWQGYYNNEQTEYTDLTNADSLQLVSYGWQVEPSSAAMTNTADNVRVDGYQSRMYKELKKFKNLRDPSL